jgi:hypothetical protein
MHVAIAGGTVGASGKREYAITDAAGHYRLVLSGAKAGEHVKLWVRRIGYQLTTREIVLAGDSTRVAGSG